MARVLIIDDDESVCEMLADLIGKIRHRAEYALNLKAGVEKASSGDFDVVFLDVNLPDGSGLDELARLRGGPSSPEVIVMTGEGDPDGAEIAIRQGAWDYLTKPLSFKKVILPVKRVLQYREEITNLRERPVLLDREGLAGNSPPVKSALEMLAQAARSEAPVLITGETGTGKELFARVLHRNTARAGGEFVVVGCSSLSGSSAATALFGAGTEAVENRGQREPGLIARANGGILFLDEICDLGPSEQKHLLRVLEDKSYRPIGSGNDVHSDFRAVASTQRDLDQAVADGTLRKDLLYRLNSIRVHLPPLGERLEDIKDLATHHLEAICRKSGTPQPALSPDVIEVFQRYPWPGNVRELVNALEAAITRAGQAKVLFPKHVPQHIRVHVAREAVDAKSRERPEETPSPPGVTPAPRESSPPGDYRKYREALLADGEKRYLEDLMAHCRGSIKKACEVSGLGRTRLYTLMKKHDVSRWR